MIYILSVKKNFKLVFYSWNSLFFKCSKRLVVIVVCFVYLGLVLKKFIVISGNFFFLKRERFFLFFILLLDLEY